MFNGRLKFVVSGSVKNRALGGSLIMNGGDSGDNSCRLVERIDGSGESVELFFFLLLIDFSICKERFAD